MSYEEGLEILLTKVIEDACALIISGSVMCVALHVRTKYTISQPYQVGGV